MFLIFRHISIQDISTSTRVRHNPTVAELTVSVQAHTDDMFQLGDDYQCDIQIIGRFILLFQGFKGIRQWPINLCTSPVIIHEINPSVD